MNLQIEPLTAQSFAGYGKVIDFPSVDARTSVIDHIVNLRPSARMSLNIVSRNPTTAPLVYPKMERHRHSSQAFIPFGATRFIVVVAPSTASGDPDTENCRAFYSTGGCAFVYDPDTWHCPLCVLGGQAFFAVSMYIAGTEDEEFLTLPRPISIWA